MLELADITEYTNFVKNPKDVKKEGILVSIFLVRNFGRL